MNFVELLVETCESIYKAQIMFMVFYCVEKPVRVKIILQMLVSSVKYTTIYVHIKRHRNRF